MKTRFFWLAGVVLAAAAMAEVASSNSPEVPYPDGYRAWRHVTSAVMLPKNAPPGGMPPESKVAAPHGLIHHVYANAQAIDGYRTGHFPEGAVLIADWFVLEEKGGGLGQGARKSINVMVRDARYTSTGGWGFEDFDHDSHTARNVGPAAVKMCFECHRRAEAHEFVFSELKP